MWTDAYLESRVLTADPVELICILYEHGLNLMAEARRQLAAGEIAARSQAISRVMLVLAELDGSLDHQAGGSLSRNLAALYGYMRGRLLEGNLKQADAPLAEVESLLRTLAEGWRAMQANNDRGSSEPAGPPEFHPEFGQFSPPPEIGCSNHTWSA